MPLTLEQRESLVAVEGVSLPLTLSVLLTVSVLLLLLLLLHALGLCPAACTCYGIHDKVKVVTVVSLMANCLETLLSLTVSRQSDVLVCRHTCNVMHVDTLSTSFPVPCKVLASPVSCLLLCLTHEPHMVNVLVCVAPG